jgi:hypothetical protein
MQNNVTGLNWDVGGPAPALMQDGGDPIPGLLTQLTGDLRQSVVKEFFLS